jgi:hypothetical protein
VLVRDDLPELCSDLVAALAGLEVDDFSHSGSGKLRKVESVSDYFTFGR